MQSQEKSADDAQCSCKNPIAQQAFSHLLFSSAWCICLCVVLSALSLKELFSLSFFPLAFLFLEREREQERGEREKLEPAVWNKHDRI